MARSIRRAIGAAVAATVTIGGVSSAGTAWARGDDSRTVVVHPGQSVQAAIDSAAPRSTILLEEGTYRGNLTITKTVNLRGEGRAVIEPASTFRSNACTEDPGAVGPGCQVAVTGIGIGRIGPGETIIKTVADVTRSRLEVRGFDGGGLFAAGTTGLEVDNVEFDHNGDCGAIADLSDHLMFKSNRADHNGNGGLHFSADRVVTAENNRADHNNAEGILFGDSSNGRLDGNELSGNCVGLLAVETGFQGHARDINITDNTVHSNDRYCPGQSGPGGRPPEGGLGIALGGTADTVVMGNTVTDNVLTGMPPGAQPPFVQGGLALVDTTGFGGAAPTNNHVTGNVIRRNQPLDVVTDGSGSHNVFQGNNCETANAPGICK